MISLEESRAYCRDIAKSRAKNFYYSFILLPAAKKDAMCAMYAFMRYCDDLSDEPGATRTAMDRWRDALTEALAGRPDASPLWPAFLDAVGRYRIPHQYFHDMIDGVASDLEPRALRTFDELYEYCYRVASVVGLTTIHIFGFDSPDALALAEKCGIAFQLTNILRDVREDAELGRAYLPAEDLKQFGVSMAALTRSEAFERLMMFEISRAQAYYEESQPLIGMIHQDSRKALRTLIAIYRSLLDRIAESPSDVLTRRISLPATEKVWIALRSAMGLG
jgi:phytoene synthase